MLHEAPVRMLTFAAVLAVTWVLVYWWWEPGEPEHPPAAEPVAERPLPIVDPLIASEPVAADPTPPPRPTPSDPPAAEDRSEPAASEASTRLMPPEFERYVTRPGDDMSKIARRFFGRSSAWETIARANPTVDPNRLGPGVTLRIPIDPDNIQGRVVDPSGAPAATETDEPPPLIEYTIQRGDTLSEIALRFYGSSRFTTFLFEANRDRLRSPSSIRLGQTILIPPKPADAP